MTFLLCETTWPKFNEFPWSMIHPSGRQTLANTTSLVEVKHYTANNSLLLAHDQCFGQRYIVYEYFGIDDEKSKATFTASFIRCANSHNS